MEIDETNIAPHVTLGEAYATMGGGGRGPLENAHRLHSQYGLSDGIPLGSALRQSSRWPKLAKMMNLPESAAL